LCYSYYSTVAVVVGVAVVVVVFLFEEGGDGG
jgi:hypothetical protein